MDRSFFSPSPDYLLKVKGDSMRDDGIFDGDLIGVHRTQEARSGQIVVARIDDEITVKLLKIGKDGIRLLPRNPDYAPIEVQRRPGFRDRRPVLRPGAAEPMNLHLAGNRHAADEALSDTHGRAFSAVPADPRASDPAIRPPPSQPVRPLPPILCPTR